MGSTGGAVNIASRAQCRERLAAMSHVRARRLVASLSGFDYWFVYGMEQTAGVEWRPGSLVLVCHQ
ncbi:MAG: hypothetical protein MI923_26895 [Phycisphaerales bacterium]|nr:hypothetical protein [Phycisphaerales bacterium]